MNLNDTLRALKDRAFRQTSQIEHPAGISAIDDAQFDAVAGAGHYTISNNGCSPTTGGGGTSCLKCEF